MTEDALDRALARTAEASWSELHDTDALHPAADPPRLEYPATLRRVLARALAIADPETAANLVHHYTVAMPRTRLAQLAGTAEPGATMFHTRLDWTRLPRLAAALDRLFALVIEAGVDPVGPLGAASADAFRARTPTLATLYARTYYGGAMPLLYGSPTDLAFFSRSGAAAGLDLHGTLDRYLTAPVIHELAHFARARAALEPPHLDECIAGWIGVHVHPAFAYPGPGEDDAIYATPWLAQVGQAIARAFGLRAVIRAHTGAEPWEVALPAEFVAAATRLGWDDWRARRTLHLLADPLAPRPWVALALLAGAGHSLAGCTLASLAEVTLRELALPADPELDRAIVGDALRAMCLEHTLIEGAVRTRTALPAGPITIDAEGCAVGAPRRAAVDQVAPRYWLPPAIAARIWARGLVGYELRLATPEAIPDAAAAICGAPRAELAGCETAGFVLTDRPRGDRSG